jgi:hypothetical protein
MTKSLSELILQIHRERKRIKNTEWMRRYRQLHPEKRREYYQKNREREIMWQRAYYQKKKTITQIGEHK